MTASRFSGWMAVAVGGFFVPFGAMGLFGGLRGDANPVTVIAFSGFFILSGVGLLAFGSRELRKARVEASTSGAL